MRYIIACFLILVFKLGFSQISYLNSTSDNVEIDWSGIEVSMTKSEKKSFLSQFDGIKDNPSIIISELEPFLDSYHVVDINGDYKLDVIQYLKETSLGESFVIYMNRNGKLERVFNQFGKILSIKREVVNSAIHVVLFSCVNSGHLTYSLDEILLLGEKSSNQISIKKESVLLYPDNFEFPEKQTINIPFVVENDKYRLRSEPKIDNVEIKSPYKLGNLIAEFTTGDTGYALAEKTDETGRVWWFVIMDNNIKKDWKEYMHTDYESEKQRNMKVYGWISSRFIKRIN